MAELAKWPNYPDLPYVKIKRSLHGYFSVPRHMTDECSRKTYYFDRGEKT